MAERPDPVRGGRASGLAIRQQAEGVLLRVRVKPKARTEEVLGIYGDALKLSVKEAPERGKANEAVCRLLGRVLQVPGGAVSVVAGETSQDKTVRIEGLAADACRARIDAVLP